MRPHRMERFSSLIMLQMELPSDNAPTVADYFNWIEIASFKSNVIHTSLLLASASKKPHTKTKSNVLCMRNSKEPSFQSKLTNFLSKKGIKFTLQCLAFAIREPYLTYIHFGYRKPKVYENTVLLSRKVSELSESWSRNLATIFNFILVLDSIMPFSRASLRGSFVEIEVIFLGRLLA